MSYKRLPLEEKKIYTNKINSLKKELKDEKIKRIEELKHKGKEISLIKIRNNFTNSKKISVILNTNLFLTKEDERKNIPFCVLDEEIEMAKKCVLNNWDFPTANFLEKKFLNEKLKNFNENNFNENQNDTITETFSNYSPEKK
jgi:hypothetical protein